MMHYVIPMKPVHVCYPSVVTSDEDDGSVSHPVQKHVVQNTVVSSIFT